MGKSKAERGLCSVRGCEAEAKSRGMCRRHYEAERRRTGPRCSVEGCERSATAKGRCNVHYEEWRRAEGLVGECSVDGCTEALESRGMCRSHYLRWRRKRASVDADFPQCSVIGCEDPAFARGVCQVHYVREQHHGHPLALVRPDPREPVCGVEGCEGVVVAQSRCAAHVDSVAVKPQGRNVGPCSESGCDAPAKTRGMCRRHYARWLRGPQPIPESVKLRAERDAQIVALVAEGRRAVEVAEMVGLTPDRVRQIVRAARNARKRPQP
jgi:hypothetical protein